MTEKSPVRKEWEKRILTKCHHNGDFGPLEDGYMYYFGKGGGICSDALRVIADELDRLNKNWNDDIDRYFADLNKG
jgi:hypothetical protein